MSKTAKLVVPAVLPHLRYDARLEKYRFDDRPLPTEEGGKVEVVRVEVDYDKGGSSAFSGKQRPRGLYLSVHPRTVEKRSIGYMEGFTLFGDGFFAFLQETKIRNARQLAEMAAKIDPIAPELARMFRLALDAGPERSEARRRAFDQTREVMRALIAEALDPAPPDADEARVAQEITELNG